MTPEARNREALDLLEAISASAQPADAVASAWFRTRRYAGSKDRAAVLDQVFSSLRHRISLGWREASGTGEGPLPDFAQAELPPWLFARFQDSFGTDALAEAEALIPEAPVDLRVATRRIAVSDVVGILASSGIPAAPAPWSPVGVRVAGRFQLPDGLKDGQVEVQDVGSQVIAALVDAEPGHRVLDRCAGGGGKTLAIADRTSQAFVLAADANPARLSPLPARLARAGATNVSARPAEANAKWLRRERFDRVLVDAPCSGIGVLRRHPDTRHRLTADQVDRVCQTQAAILDEVAPLVSPGGRLIYATCSVLREENQTQVQSFLGRHPEFALVPVAEIWARVGLLGDPPGLVPEGLLLSPRRSATDGFFVSILTRALGAHP